MKKSITGMKSWVWTQFYWTMLYTFIRFYTLLYDFRTLSYGLKLNIYIFNSQQPIQIIAFRNLKIFMLQDIIVCSVKLQNYRIRVTNFVIARNAMFPWPFFIFFVEIIKENIVVQYKIRHVYSTIHQLWSNSH